ncbi:MAG: acetyl-CoA carboxylase, carboxyltransferase subunit beta [Candidatus Erginobacter occultus]|nr:acetyl-CoA carboxylase, carboxyltransferase subunit beta [Candidatus Erginobacter occultus]
MTRKRTGGSLLARLQRRRTRRKASPFLIRERTLARRKHQCPFCHRHIEEGELEKNFFVCPECSHHFRLSPRERIRLLVDPDSFRETDRELTTLNPLDFPGYEEKIRRVMNITELGEAVVTGVGAIEGWEISLAVMSFQFMGGSMGSVVGEKIARAILAGVRLQLPVVVFTASGGARMQEGIFSLMQMAKTARAAGRLEEAGLPLFVVLTDPTMGGVTASFGMLGDVTLAEPGALIGFAGPRVLEGTIKEKLPDDFQRSEFLLHSGFIDRVVEREKLRSVLAFLLKAHTRPRLD